MQTGISEDRQNVSDSKKTAVKNNELVRLIINVDIPTLQETRLADSSGVSGVVFWLPGNPHPPGHDFFKSGA